MNSLDEICTAILETMKKSVSETIFALWFQDLSLTYLDENRAVFSIPSDFKRDIIANKHIKLIHASTESILGFPVEIEITSSQADQPIPIPSFPDHTPAVEEKEPLYPIFKEDEDKKEKDITSSIESNMIVEEYTFDNFIVGESNKLAHGACMAAATNRVPHFSQNPLFIYGQSGLGKTHLLYAVTNEIKRNNPNVKIIYKKGEDFTNELITALTEKNPLSFREKYRKADVLLIDDIQFIAGKESTQEEFFHTFNALYEAKKRIILTSDRPPRDIKTLEERLRTRFEWGLTADIQPPSFELRTAIILKKAQSLRVDISPEIVEFLAEKLQNNIRQIEGAIKKIAAISQLTATPVTLDMCRRTIADFVTGPASVSSTLETIFRVVSKKYGVSIEDIKSKKRNEPIVNARHISIHLIRHLTDLPLTSIGDIFQRDHATVIASLRKIEKEIEARKSLEYEIEEMIAEIKA